MSTITYPSPISGIISSRRLGLSLGINVMPGDGKVCTFDCLYCECGLNARHRPMQPRPSRERVAEALESCLRDARERGVELATLTFSGNGEPTLHPDFAGIMEDTVRLRDAFCPKAKVTVLSNATTCGRSDVRRALLMADNIFLKLDTVDGDYVRRVDRPTQPSYSVAAVVEAMKAYRGRCTVQTIFMHGTALVPQADGVPLAVEADNVSERYIAPWLAAVAEIAPRDVTVYTVDRETATPGLTKATHAELDAIAGRVRALGFPCTVGY